MFFKKPKLNPKVRFQKSDFRKQLQEARGYKRNQAQAKFFRFFREFSYLLWVTPVLLLVLAVIYFLYVPNFLFFKSIDINGLSLEDKRQALNLVNDYFKISPIKNQKNFLLLSKSGLKDYLTKNDQNILSVLEIKKIFPNTLIIEVKPRTPGFLLNTPDTQFLLSNDGIIQQSVSKAISSSTIPSLPNLTVIDVLSTTTPQMSGKVLSQDSINSINDIKTLMPSNIHIQPTKFILTELNSSFITVTTNAGFLIKLNLNSNKTELLHQIELILNNMQDSQRKNLYYIDMRFQDRGFACFKGTFCAQ